MTTWYRMNDANPRGVFEIAPTEAGRWNERGHGIFATVNSFDGPRRIENLTRINAWAVDIDEGTKAEQVERISSSPIIPSAVVETKNGHHVHWRAQDGASADNYAAIVSDRLVPFFDADPRARDVARILRVPGFFHLKDPRDPFMVTAVWRHSVAYSESQMLRAFPDASEGAIDDREQRDAHRISQTEYKAAGGASGDALWDAVYNLDCREGLLRLSGHPAVSGEVYTFRRTRNGHNIVVDGKGTSCWVDRNGRIGSGDKGGPTLYQWLRWFRVQPGECVRVLKEIFPHLEEADRNAA